MKFTGQARSLSSNDVSLIAGYLGCEVAMIRAVLAIESSGKGFDRHGRPTILFEPHIFYRHLEGENRNKAVAEGIAYPHWKRDYPADSYPRLQKAIAIDETAALKSASWGLGQIMGENYKACGFESVQSFVEAMKLSEGAQLYAMARYIASNYMQKYLQEKNFAGFALRYNGPGYAKNHYDTKLKTAYLRRPKSEKIIPLATTEGQMEDMLRPDLQPAPEPQKQPQGRKTGAAAVVVAATTVAATQGDSWPIIAAIVAGGIALAIVLYLVLNKKG